MKIAYLILAHKNPKQVKRFINILEGDIYIHIDAKRYIKDFSENIEKKNCYFIDKQISINWGGFTMIEATLNLIKIAFENSRYDYFVLLSGDDYLLKSEKLLENKLEEDPTKNYLEYIDFKKEWKSRYERYYMEGNKSVFKVLNKIMKILPKRKMFNGMVPYKGSQWWILNRESIDYLLNYIEVNKGCLKYFKYTRIPDEMFFQTILLNSPLKGKIVNENLRFIKLENEHPEIITRKNISEALELSNKYFARKFDYTIDEIVLNKIDEMREM